MRSRLGVPVTAAGFNPLLICFLMFACLLVPAFGFQEPASPQPQQKGELPLIAGHKVLKVLDRSNSPLGSPRLRPSLTFQDSAGRYWIGGGSLNDVVELYDEGTESWTVFGNFGNWSKQYYKNWRFVDDVVLPSKISTIAQSADNKLWFSSDRETNRIAIVDVFTSWFDGNQWQKHEEKIDKEDEDYISIFQGRNGRVWFCLGDRLSYYDGKNWSPVIKLSDEIRDPAPIITPSMEGTSKAKLAEFFHRNGYKIHRGIQDSNGYVWLKTVKGIIRYDEYKREWKKFPQIDLRPWLISEDRTGRIWFSDWEDATVYDAHKDTFTTYEPLKHIPKSSLEENSAFLKAIYQDKKGGMLFAFNVGLLYYSEAKNTWEFFDLSRIGLRGSLQHIMEDKSGRIWLTTTAGIAVLEQ